MISDMCDGLTLSEDREEGSQRTGEGSGDRLSEITAPVFLRV